MGLVAPLLLCLLAVTTALPAQEEGTRTPIAELQPLPAAADVVVPAEALEARAALLGPHALDPGYVTLHWYGVASFLVTIRGHLLLFDAWEIVGANEDYVPIGREELAALDPEAILDRPRALRPRRRRWATWPAAAGAVVVGSEEICDDRRRRTPRRGQRARFRCAITGTTTTPAPGTTQPFRLFADVAPVTVLQHIHSAATPAGQRQRARPVRARLRPTPYLDEPQPRPRRARAVPRGRWTTRQGGTWLYHLTVGDFTLLLGDSAGPIFDQPEPSGRRSTRSRAAST